MNLSKALYAAYQQGNAKKIEQLFDWIYEEYADLVFVLISKYVYIKEDIEELTNDVFISFFTHLEDFNPKKSLKYYLMTSAKNHAISYLRRWNRYVAIDMDSIEAQHQEDSSYNELIEEWKKCLSEEEIRLILKHVLEGYELKEIATLEHRSMNTVKSSYRRAIQKLRKMYKEGEEDEKNRRDDKRKIRL